MENKDEKKMPVIQKKTDDVAAPVAEHSEKNVTNRASLIPKPAGTQTMIKQKSNSGIPLPAKPQSGKAIKGKANSYEMKMRTPITPSMDKHTLENQFNNSKKRLIQMQEEFVLRQQPLIDLYKNLQSKKEKLEKLGKTVQLGDLKFVNYALHRDDVKSLLDNEIMPNNKIEISHAELIANLKACIKNFNDSLIDMYTDYQSKTIDLLEKVPNSEDEPPIDLDALKDEGIRTKHALLLALKENEIKVIDFVKDYTMVSFSPENEETKNKIKMLEERVKLQEDVLVSKNRVIDNNMKEREENRFNHEKTIAELEDKIAKLDEELKNKKKILLDNNARNLSNAQTIKQLRTQITELEKYKIENEKIQTDITGKLKAAQEHFRRKELQWAKEKQDKDAIIQKLTEEKKQLDLRGMVIHEKLTECEKEDKIIIEKYQAKMEKLQEQVDKLQKTKEKSHEKIDELQNELDRLKNVHQDIVEDNVLIKQYKDKAQEYERKIKDQAQRIAKMDSSLTAHSRVIAVLKLEDEASENYIMKLRDTLKEAKETIEMRTKALYDLHEKYNELKKEIKKLRNNLGPSKNLSTCIDKVNINRMADFQSLNACDVNLLYDNDKIGKLNYQTLRSDSLIDMSLREIDRMRYKLHHLSNLDLNIRHTSSSTLNAIDDQIFSTINIYQNLQKRDDKFH